MMHQMTLAADHEGTEEWYCPMCGRRMLYEWEPFRQVVIESGDVNAGHAGSKGGLQIGSIGINTDE